MIEMLRHGSCSAPQVETGARRGDPGPKLVRGLGICRDRFELDGSVCTVALELIEVYRPAAQADVTISPT